MRVFALIIAIFIAGLALTPIASADPSVTPTPPSPTWTPPQAPKEGPSNDYPYDRRGVFEQAPTQIPEIMGEVPNMTYEPTTGPFVGGAGQGQDLTHEGLKTGSESLDRQLHPTTKQEEKFSFLKIVAGVALAVILGQIFSGLINWAAPKKKVNQTESTDDDSIVPVEHGDLTAPSPGTTVS